MIPFAVMVWVIIGAHTEGRRRGSGRISRVIPIEPGKELV